MRMLCQIDQKYVTVLYKSPFLRKKISIFKIIRQKNMLIYKKSILLPDYYTLSNYALYK
jgi:hypothetical protein